MIICPLCKTENHHLQVICVKCGGFLQAKVENIDLFDTLWKLIENPQKAFKQIAKAKTKNYTIFLCFLFGISFTFLLMEFYRIGDIYLNAPVLILIAFIGGLPLGFIILTILTILIILLGKIFKLITKWKNTFAVNVYSVVPIVYVLLFIMPIKLLTFGINHFSSNPSPAIINPMVYYITFGLEGFFSIWLIILHWISMRILFDTGWFKSLLISFVSLGILSTLLISVFYFVREYLIT